MSNNIDMDAVMAEARNHPRCDTDPCFYETLARLKLRAAMEREGWDAKLQNIQDDLKDIVKTTKRTSEKKRKFFYRDFMLGVALYFWLMFLGVFTLFILLLNL